MSGPIIATTDFAARADRAIDRAIVLGRQLNRRVIVFHARDMPSGSAQEPHGLDQRLREVLPPGATEVDCAYRIGSAPQAITDYADAKEASLIVMGVARHHSLGEFLLGSSVDQVIRRTDRPVLVVKRRPHGDYATIAVATDFSSFSLAAVAWAARTFPAAPIHLLHAYHVPYPAWNKAEYVAEEIEGYANEQMVSFVDDLAADIRPRITSHVVEGSVEGAMNRLVETAAIDLIVLGSHGETGFRHATIGSQANALLTCSTADTIIVGPRVSG